MYKLIPYVAISSGDRWWCIGRQAQLLRSPYQSNNNYVGFLKGEGAPRFPMKTETFIRIPAKTSNVIDVCSGMIYRARRRYIFRVFYHSFANWKQKRRNNNS